MHAAAHARAIAGRLAVLLRVHLLKLAALGDEMAMPAVASMDAIAKNACRRADLTRLVSD